MTYLMLCKQFRHEQKRCWFSQEREFVMPVSAKQIEKQTRGNTKAG